MTDIPDWAERLGRPMRHEAHFGDRVVRCFGQRPSTVHETFAAAVRERPDADALVFGSERWRYRALDEEVARLAAGLRAHGVNAGDRVALFLSNRAEYMVAVYAVLRLAAIVVPISVREQGAGLAYMLGQCGARAVLFDADLAARVPDAASCPTLALRVVLPPNPIAPVLGPDPAPVTDAVPYETLRGQGRLDEPVTAAEEDTAVILYTSGTTGRPKGAMLSNLGIVHTMLHFVACMGLDAGTRSVMAVPASHVTGLVANIMTTVAAGGATIVMASFKARDYLALAARERCSYTILVPAMYKLCLLDPDFERHDLSAWRIGGYGGAPMPESTIDELARRLPGLALMNAYGATETTSPTTIMPAECTRENLDSVGLVVPCGEIIAVDDDGRELPRGETGELWISGPMVVRGYWDNPEATAREFTAGWWHSGDLGSVDAQGFVRVFDRKKDMINRGGYKIFSVEVENLMLGFPGVVEAAVLGRPCPVLGERVHAFVHTAGAEIDTGALREWCAQRLADYKVPETITVHAEPLPRNANGKLLKRQLRDALDAG
ncbi:MAG: class I adenylate-forming enzyme family protein [Burkholderiaceae bacterium]